MALNFPLSRAGFFGTLRISLMEMRLGGGVEVSRSAGGEVITAERGARLWQGSVHLAPGPHADIAATQALLHRLCDSGTSFLIHDPAHAYPAFDPDGTILGAASVTIHALPGNREIMLAGLPQGYELQVGDYLAFSYGSGPTRRALHQIVTGGTANGSGVTPALELVPERRPGASTGTTVILRQPPCKALIVPESLSPKSARAAQSAGLRFDFLQTLR